MNYNVLLATDDLISVEMSEYSDSGGAHPNTGFWSLTYDLSGDKELELDDLFKPGSDYKIAIAKFVVADIDRRAIAFEQEDARTEGRKPGPHESMVYGSIVRKNELGAHSKRPGRLFRFPSRYRCVRPDRGSLQRHQ